MSTPAASLTPQQIRRRANDYDSQIRQGLEDGNVREVVKRLGSDLVSSIFFYKSFLLTHCGIGPISEPPLERNAGTTCCISKAVVPATIRSGMEAGQEGPEFYRRPNGRNGTVRQGATPRFPHPHARSRRICCAHSVSSPTVEG
jgi:hypothetical protein